MIKAGHIGIGIIGKEGMESVNAADFAIGQFRFLRNLLLLHGRHNYRRFAIFLYFTFYKNIVTVMTMYFWSCFALGSGTLLFPSVFTDLLNPVMVTSLPILLYPMFDTDIDQQTSLQSPALYSPGIMRVHYTKSKLALWVAEAVYTAAITAYVPAFMTYSGGVDMSLSECAMTSMWAVCLTIDARLVLENHSWTKLDLFGVFAMVLVLLFWTVFFGYINNDSPGSFGWGFLFGSVGQLFPRPNFWLVLLMSLVLSLAPRALLQVYM